MPAREISPWPEFAEYGCFSCHHDLRDDAWRRQRPAGPAPQHFGLGLLDDADDARARKGVYRRSRRPAILRIHRPAHRPHGHTRPRANQRHKPCPQDRPKSLGRCLEVLASKPMDARRWRRSWASSTVARPGNAFRAGTRPSERYLALVPLYQARLALAPDQAPEIQSLRQEIDSLLEKLKFPPSFDSPDGFDPSLLPMGR